MATKKTSDFTDFEIEFGMLLMQLKKIAQGNMDKLTKFFCYICSEILLAHEREQLTFARDDAKNLSANLVGAKRTIQWQAIISGMQFLFEHKEEYGYAEWTDWEKVTLELLQLITERFIHKQKISSSLIERLFVQMNPELAIVITE